jgi:hypothetical protein
MIPGGRAAACGVWFAALVAAGCAAAPLYQWGAYEQYLQASYVAHDETRAASALEASLAAAEQAHGRVPPGLCADYGFLLYQRGRRDEAVAYFRREMALFPESKPLMEKLIARLEARPNGDRDASDGTADLP